jgi:hypothetical protein
LLGAVAGPAEEGQERAAEGRVAFVRITAVVPFWAGVAVGGAHQVRPTRY